MNSEEIPNQFLSIDESGFIFNNEEKITSTEIGLEVLKSLFFLSNNSYGSQFHGQPVIVEAFDTPLVVHSIEKLGDQLKLYFHYGFSIITDITNFYLDDFDRIYGELENGIPFSFSKSAQVQFFSLLDEYSDEDFIWNEKAIPFHSFWQDNTQLHGANWWNKVYEEEANPRWNLAAPSETLKDMLPRIKLPKSKVLVLGCGDSHDAAFFAEHGHLVTAVDISPHAIERSKKLFGHLENITWHESDLFHLPNSYFGQFDLIYEYTCFCAIDPAKRKDLIKVWTQCLHEQGQLMGTFFCMHKRVGPPFGSTEWELRERLKRNFQFIFWGRWRKSLPRRQGRELFILAKKKNL